MPIATSTTISSNNRHHCHHHHQQDSAAAVADGQLVVVVRMVDDLRYLVLFFFFQWRSNTQQQQQRIQLSLPISANYNRLRHGFCLVVIDETINESFYLLYHAACKVEFQPFTRSYSQLTLFNFIWKRWTSRRNTNTSPITPYLVCNSRSSYSGQHVIYQTLK